MTSLAIQGTAAPSFCSPATNRLGTQAFTSTALGQINTAIQGAIDSGAMSTLQQWLGLDDLTGVADPSIETGFVDAELDPAAGAWPGGSPIDWRFLVDHRTVDATGLPSGRLTGSLAARGVTTSAGTIVLPLEIAGSPAFLTLVNAQLAATLNGTPAPNVPAPPPTTLAAGLTVFQTLTASSSGQGLCGGVTVESLAQVPVPQSFTAGAAACSASCTGSRAYTYCGANMPVGPTCNSLLDVIVGGCRTTSICIAAVNAQQPDVIGADGDIDTLTVGTGNKVPLSQVTGNTDAYSVYLTFDANRAHATGETCGASTDCIAGLTCTAGTCQ